MADSRADIIAAARAALLEQAVAFVGGRTPEERQRFRQRVSELLDDTDEDELFETVTRLQTTGSDWGYQPPDPFARRMHHAMGDVAITPDSTLDGLEHLDALAGEKLVFAANHLSYSDANLLEILLARHDREYLAERLAVIAGPKVYSELFRRFSSLCFGTIKTPQSSSRSSGDAVMSPRDVARIAKDTIAEALRRVDAGDALVLFVEGTRSRSARMQRALAATVRYFEHPGVRILPVGIAGSEQLIPVGDEHVHPTRVSVRFGPPIDARSLLDRTLPRRQLAIDVVGVAIARQLPAAYQGVYGEDSAEVTEATRLLDTL